MKNIILAGRILISMSLVYWVYKDVGFVVATFCFLSFLSTEAQVVINSFQRDINEILRNKIERLEANV